MSDFSEFVFDFKEASNADCLVCKRYPCLRCHHDERCGGCYRGISDYPEDVEEFCVEHGDFSLDWESEEIVCRVCQEAIYNDELDEEDVGMWPTFNTVCVKWLHQHLHLPAKSAAKR